MWVHILKEITWRIQILHLKGIISLRNQKLSRTSATQYTFYASLRVSVTVLRDCKIWYDHSVLWKYKSSRVLKRSCLLGLFAGCNTRSSKENEQTKMSRRIQTISDKIRRSWWGVSCVRSWRYLSNLGSI